MSAPLPSEALGLEVELKFEMTTAQVRTLTRSAFLKTMQSAVPRTKILRATYFDTSGLKLAGRELSLRVRKEGRYFVQCLKANANDVGEGVRGGGFARHEWEWRVPGPDLDVSVLRADADIKMLFKGIGFVNLVPIYSTDIRRQSRELHTLDGAVIQCDIDQGCVSYGDQQSPVCEVELELKFGPLEDLLNVAQMVVETTAARLSNRTKAYRGHVLAQVSGPGWVPATHPPLPKKVSAEDVLRASMSTGLQHLISNEDCVLARHHSEGVHQMRIALRRMRSVITTYKKLLPQGSYEVLSQGLKDAGSQLGAARDWDVFLAEVLAPVERGFENDPALALMKVRAEERQYAAYEQADRLIHSPQYARLLCDALRWVGTSGWRTGGKNKPSAKLSAPATNIAKEILAKRHARLIKAGKGLKHLSIEQRHALRIAIKKARYAAQFFAELYPDKTTKSYIRTLKRLQESLGHLNDLATAERLMVDLAGTQKGRNVRAINRAAGMVEGWYMHAQIQREEDLQRAWKRFAKAKIFW